MNRLALEKSPYLLQHSNNPVDWRPWGEEAFEAARTQDKPIFLSIGYSTCHWCHVMERESFENQQIAEVLNRDFIPIKLDREERPDIDRIYMIFIQATTGSGGWPMSIFLTPDLKPFFGGTYFPPQASYGRPGFNIVLEQIAKAWQQQRDHIETSTENILAQLKSFIEVSSTEKTLDPKALADQTFSYLRRNFDSEYGGFSSAPKFPRPVVLNFLFRHHYLTRNDEALKMAVKTLKEMSKGGMRDLLGGGFHRYSVDLKWFVPHFEKMLYDQAQLAVSYIEAWQITKDNSFARVASETLDYVLRDLRHPEGGFFSAEDADSSVDPAHPHEKSEGAYYLWSWDELEHVVGKASMPAFAKRFHVAKDGNVKDDPQGEFMRKNILHLSADDDEPIALDLREKLLVARERRMRPGLDDKVLTAWNGLMISAFAIAGRALNEPRYIEAAMEAERFIEAKLMDEQGVLLRRFRDGEAAIPGFLDDYAFFIQALIDLYETTANPHYLELSVLLATDMMNRFEDKQGGGFFSTASTDQNLVLRIKDDQDGAEPSGNSYAVQVLSKLGQITQHSAFEESARRTLKAFTGRLNQQGMAMPQMIVAAMATPRQVILEGPEISAYLEVLNRYFLPYHVRIFRPDGPNPGAYICENNVCQLPVHSSTDLEALLN